MNLTTMNWTHSTTNMMYTVKHPKWKMESDTNNTTTKLVYKITQDWDMKKSHQEETMMWIWHQYHPYSVWGAGTSGLSCTVWYVWVPSTTSAGLSCIVWYVWGEKAVKNIVYHVCIRVSTRRHDSASFGADGLVPGAGLQLQGIIVNLTLAVFWLHH